MDADKPPYDSPSGARGHLEAAYADFEAERYESALSECEAALELAPRWAEAHNLRGVVLDELDRLREAAEAYHAALEIDPDDADARDNLLGALTEMMTGELSALADLEDEDQEELAIDHLQWAYELFDEEDKEDLELALWECDLAINLLPGLAEAHNLRGLVLDQLRRPEEAKEAFRTALEFDPDFRAARKNLDAMEAEERGEPEPDAPAARVGVVRCPICGTENPATASSCRQCGFGLTAASATEGPAAEIPAPAPDVLVEEGDRAAEGQHHLDLAYDHNEKGLFAEALSECEAALEAAPDPAEAHNLRGIVLEALGRPLEALDEYRKAVQLEPGFADARENLHELAAELGESDPVVTVTTFTNPLEAHAARLALAEQGIWSQVLDETLQITGIRLVARESDLEDIAQVLDLETDDDEGWQCPQCGSWDVDVPLVGRKRRCESCGYEWKV